MRSLLNRKHDIIGYRQPRLIQKFPVGPRTGKNSRVSEERRGETGQNLDVVGVLLRIRKAGELGTQKQPHPYLSPDLQEYTTDDGAKVVPVPRLDLYVTDVPTLGALGSFSPPNPNKCTSMSFTDIRSFFGFTFSVSESSSALIRGQFALYSSSVNPAAHEILPQLL